MIAKLTDLFNRRFAGSRIVFEEPRAGARLAGWVIWAGFDGLEQSDRQQIVWDVVRAELLPEEQMRLMAILTVTEDELSVMQEA